jgi:hypothetical protein
MRFYNKNISEYLKDGYFENNTAICNDKYPAVNFVTDYASGSLQIWELNEKKFNLKEIDEALLKTVSLSVGTDSLYYLESTADYVGLFRYKIVVSDNTYYSDTFKIIDAPSRNDYAVKESGVLKFYDEDTLEFLKDGYLEINTEIEFNRGVYAFYFDSGLTISSVTSKIYKISRDDLSRKILTETELKDLTVTYTGSKVYYNDLEQLEEGLYRIQATVSPTVGDDVVFYSELFCVKRFADWVFETDYWDDSGYWWDDEFCDFS